MNNNKGDYSVMREYYDLIRSGNKIAEGRVFVDSFKQLTPGEIIRFHPNGHSDEGVLCQITDIVTFASFREMLEEGRLHHFLPHIEDIEEGVSIYHGFPNYEKDAQMHGVVGFYLKKLS